MPEHESGGVNTHCRPIITTYSVRCIFSAKLHVSPGEAFATESVPQNSRLMTMEWPVRRRSALSCQIKSTSGKNGRRSHTKSTRKDRFAENDTSLRAAHFDGPSIFPRSPRQQSASAISHCCSPSMEKAVENTHTQSRVSLSATIIIVIPSVAGTACWLRELPLGFAFLIPRLQKEATTTAQALPRTMPASFVTLRAQIFDSRPRPNFHAKNADCSFLCETLFRSLFVLTKLYCSLKSSGHAHKENKNAFFPFKNIIVQFMAFHAKGISPNTLVIHSAREWVQCKYRFCIRFFAL